MHVSVQIHKLRNPFFKFYSHVFMVGVLAPMIRDVVPSTHALSRGCGESRHQLSSRCERLKAERGELERPSLSFHGRPFSFDSCRASVSRSGHDVTCAPMIHCPNELVERGRERSEVLLSRPARPCIGLSIFHLSNIPYLAPKVAHCIIILLCLTVKNILHQSLFPDSDTSSSSIIIIFFFSLERERDDRIRYY